MTSGGKLDSVKGGEAISLQPGSTSNCPSVNVVVPIDSIIFFFFKKKCQNNLKLTGKRRNNRTRHIILYC